ncbi:MAG TPA: hypothetical protein VFV63_05285 [Ilumatobacteraceae bacterium]|nr:hypothetical protein [Ilumatobacteraceae bacterium]
MLLTEIGDLTGSNLDAGVVVGSYDDLSPGKAYFVEMNTSRQKPWIVFETEELPTDAVISSGRLMSLGEFRDGAGAEFC